MEESAREEALVWHLDRLRQPFGDLDFRKFLTDEPIEVSNFITQDEKANVTFYLEHTPEIVRPIIRTSRQPTRDLVVQLKGNNLKDIDFDCYAIVDDKTYKGHLQREREGNNEDVLAFANWSQEEKDTRGDVTYRNPAPLALTHGETTKLFINLVKRAQQHS